MQLWDLVCCLLTSLSGLSSVLLQLLPAVDLEDKNTAHI